MFHIPMINNQKIYFIVGTSWSGKTTIIKHILDQYTHIKYLCSYTTRPLRPGEINGEKYNFIDTTTFEKSIQNQERLEYAYTRQQSYRYGTKKWEIQQLWEQWYDVIKEIDVLWLEQTLNSEIKNNIVSIFLAVTPETMRTRLSARGNTSPDQIRQVIEIGKQESILAKQYCNHIIDANQNLDQVVTQVKNCIDKYAKS